jgi:alkylhydroperoxidase family enzyme
VEEMAMLEGTTRIPPTLRALVNRRVASWNGCEF